MMVKRVEWHGTLRDNGFILQLDIDVIRKHLDNQENNSKELNKMLDALTLLHDTIQHYNNSNN